jgi:hypothetical protein
MSPLVLDGYPAVMRQTIRSAISRCSCRRLRPVRSGVSGPPGSGEQLAWSRALVLDLGAARLYLQAEIRRLACRLRAGPHRDRALGRPGARFTHDFEDVVAYLDLMGLGLAGCARLIPSRRQGSTCLARALELYS